MKIAFRADASLRIGTGHVMRCLTLATALAERGAECVFLCRALEGHLCDRIEAAGFACRRLPAPQGGAVLVEAADHAAWAGVSWEQDAAESAAILANEAPDWLVVDHYAFDARWERAVLPGSARLMVIDDLADRPHVADLLLDQNLGRSASDYDGLVPQGCTRLIGPGFALLRPEFAACRAAALDAREGRAMEQVLVSMGGVDLDDHSSRVLRALAAAGVPEGASVTVVIGAAAPARAALERLAREVPFDCEVLAQVDNLHELIAGADIAIGAAGVSAWERCCLGLPTLVVPIAANQRPGAAALAAAGAVLIVEPEDTTFDAALGVAFSALSEDARRGDVADKSAQVCDGDGALRVMRALLGGGLEFRSAARLDSRRIWEWRRAGRDALLSFGRRPGVRGASRLVSARPGRSHAACADRRTRRRSRRLFAL
ncbi:MAG: UDP-2,4-diacetamido-2,4,6-trideoxy-beta-L-altropyranose hydrolase [Paracoccaceae bacterium]